jgi:chromosomal replication initiator protein
MDGQIKYIWEEARKLLERELTGVTMKVWMQKLEPVSAEGDTFVFLASDEFARQTIEDRYKKEIEQIIRELTEKDYDVKILTRERTESSVIPIQESNIKYKYVFETFVRGKSNELAYAACLAVAQAPGKTSYNPLFLYGGVGLGKTHLMHSIGNYVKSRDYGAKVLYCSTETFTNELINSIKERRNQEFRDKYREIDVLLIDDIQFLSEKEGTQEEFFHTFNTLYEANKQIVISSDQPPKQLKILEDRLRSRFGAGLIVDISSPDYETRFAILDKKAEFDNVEAPKEVLSYIAKNIASNIRELEGALNKVIAFATLCKTPITVSLAETALREYFLQKERVDISVAYVQEVVSSHYNLTPADLRGKKRNARIARPRQIAMYLSRKLIDMSLPKIGEHFGGRDHSTVIHACDKIALDIEKDPEFSIKISDLEKVIKGEKIVIENEFSVDNFLKIVDN